MSEQAIYKAIAKKIKPEFKNSVANKLIEKEELRCVREYKKFQENIDNSYKLSIYSYTANLRLFAHNPNISMEEVENLVFHRYLIETHQEPR